MNITVLNCGSASLPSRATPQLDTQTGNPPTPFSQGNGVVDVPGSHYCKSSESYRGSFMDSFFSFFFFCARLWDHFESWKPKILCCKYADLVIMFSWSACLLLPKCLPPPFFTPWENNCCLPSISQRNSSPWLRLGKKKNILEVFYMLPQIVLH